MLASDGVLKPLLAGLEDLQNIPTPDLRNLYHYWLGKKGHREMPTRADIRPAEIVSLLSKIILIDVEEDPRRFKFRLVGTDIVQAMGQDVTGIYMDDISSNLSAQDRLDWLVKNKSAYYVTTKLDWLDRGFQKYRILVLPLGNEHGEVNMVLGGIFPYF